MLENPSQTVELPKVLDKFHEVELQKVIDASIALNAERVQIGYIYGTLLFAIFGIAFTSQKAGVLLLGVLLLSLYLYLDATVRGSQAAYSYRAIQLQSKFATDDKDALFPVILGVSSKTEAHLRKLASKPDTPNLKRIIRYMGFLHPTLAGFWVPIIGILFCFALFLIVWLIAGWKFL